MLDQQETAVKRAIQWPAGLAKSRPLLKIVPWAMVAFGASSLGSVARAALDAPVRHVRHPPIAGAPNFRDLGGYRAVDGRTVRWGVLYRSDALSDLTDHDRRYLLRLNIGRVVDFREPDEIARDPDRLPPVLANRSTNLPVGESVGDHTTVDPSLSQQGTASAFNDLSNEDKLRSIDKALTTEMYPDFVRHATPAYRAWLHGLLDTPGAAQVFHCTGGADRTGFAAAVLLLVLGVPKDTVVKDYLLTNRYLFIPKGRAILDKRMDIKLPATMQLHPKYLQAAFDQMTRDYGSVDNYLRQGLGVDDIFRESLRMRYLE